MRRRTTYLLIGLIAAMASAQNAMETVSVSTSTVTGIGQEQGVMRRDPSDVIKVGDLYYVWYSKGPQRTGYDATVWYATSRNGRNWQEQSMALAKGEPGSWEAGSVFTPNIMIGEGRYWLFYSGVSKTYAKGFKPDTQIGIAVSDSPDGPWERLATNPVLSKSEDPSKFDSYLVDDACLVFRDGKYWFYYKGRQAGKGPTETNMGVAIADRPEGPYVKYEGNPIVHGTHEVLVWPHGSGVATMVRGKGKPQLANSVAHSEDGIHFKRLYNKRGGASSGGGYRPENFSGSQHARPIEWGASLHFAGPDKRLLHAIGRFDIKWPESQNHDESGSEKLK
ncbi:family 43 glycosylhydrolase [Planctomycetota bacterium]